MRKAQAIIAVWGMLVVPASAHAQYLVELTFDDQAEGTGEATGHADVVNLEPNALVPRLAGPAVRTAITDGRYGRGVAFPDGTGTLLIGGWKATPNFLAYAFVRPNDTSAGGIVGQQGAFIVRLAAGELVVQLTDTSGTANVEQSGVVWPTDDAFHHLSIRYERSPEQTRFFLSIDFAEETVVSFDTVFDVSIQAPLRFGVGLNGTMDEVIVTARTAATVDREADRFNRMSDTCVGALTCAEEVFTMTPPGLSHAVPVRFKTAYDPALCSASSPCPLLIQISGGGNCANDYATPDDVARMAQEGFVVATVDPYCESGVMGFIPTTEIPQLIAAKDTLFGSSGVKNLVSGPDYMAGGCSHGADAVMIWALYEDDRPARTFARSSTGAGLCGHVAGKVCGFDASRADMESPQFQASHALSDFVSAVTLELVQTREIARAWGVNLEGPVCNADGTAACYEEGTYPNTYGSRRFRAVWEQVQSADAPTGYFVEDLSADCQHCAPSDSEAFRCGACMLRHGRAGMASACPTCLTYDDPTISAGGPAEACPIDASWYTDPLQTEPDPVDAGPGEADVSPSVEGSDTGSSPTPSDLRETSEVTEPAPRPTGGEASDGCVASRSRQTMTLGLVAMLGLVAVRRRAAVGRSSVRSPATRCG